MRALAGKDSRGSRACSEAAMAHGREIQTWHLRSRTRFKDATAGNGEARNGVDHNLAAPSCVRVCQGTRKGCVQRAPAGRRQGGTATSSKLGHGGVAARFRKIQNTHLRIWKRIDGEAAGIDRVAHQEVLAVVVQR